MTGSVLIVKNYQYAYESACLPSRSLARAYDARLISFVWWNMREAHVPPHKIFSRGEAARAPGERGRSL